MGSEQVERFEAEADSARGRIASTIDDIETRLDPRRILTDAISRVSSRAGASGQELATRAVGSVKAHPLAFGAALAAVAIALLARNQLSKATVNLGDDTADYTDYDDGQAAPEAFYDDGEEVEATEEAAESNPVVSILIGLAAGAALGLIFPATEAERQTFRQTGNKLGAAAGSAARRAMDELGAAAGALRP